MYSIQFHNKKVEINDQELANAIVEEVKIDSRKRARLNLRRKEAQEIVYFAHI